MNADAESSSSRTTAARSTTTPRCSRRSGPATTLLAAARAAAARCRRARRSALLPGRRPGRHRPRHGRARRAARGQGRAAADRPARGRRDPAARLHAHVPARPRRARRSPTVADDARPAAVGLHRGGARAATARSSGRSTPTGGATGARGATRREDLPGRVERALARAGNPIYRQLARCALEWRCFTAQNTFYARDEGAIPSSASCNAACVGCLSEQQEGMPPSSHERIARPPTAEEMAEVALRHLERATGKRDGQLRPGLRGRAAHALEGDRARASGSSARGPRAARIHANTNGSLPDALGAARRRGARLGAASRSTRASPDLYAAYYRPRGYGLADVVRWIRAANRGGAVRRAQPAHLPGRHRSRRRGGAALRAGRDDRGGPGADAAARHRPGRLHGARARRAARAGAAIGIRALVRGAQAGRGPGSWSGTSRARAASARRGPRRARRGAARSGGAMTRAEAELAAAQGPRAPPARRPPWVFRKAMERAPKGLAARAPSWT